MTKKLLTILLLIFTTNVFAQQLTSSISQYGITWTFDKNYTYGQFVNGDYWVVGPVTIIAITPASVVVNSQNNRVINGSMLNPAINFLQGYDSQMLGTEGRCWDASLNVARPGGNNLTAVNPLTISASSSLTSSISREVPEGGLNVLTVAVLTVLDQVPLANAFRPPFVGSNNKSITHTKSDIKRGILPKLAKPSGVWTTIEEVSAYFEKPWVEHMQDWQKEAFCPPNNMPNYGREIASRVSDGALMLMLDIDSTAKELLLIRMIQLGLDYYGIVKSPNGRVTWKADGGHMSGRAFPLVFAGYMLNDKTILDVMKKTGQYAYQNGHYEGSLPSDYIHFGEIDQTFYVTQRDVDRTHSADWSPDNRGNTPEPYEVSDIGMAEWGINHVHAPLGDNKALEATYRRVNLPSWCGFILASRILGIASLWNHPPLFDCAYRWVASGAAQEPGLTDLQKKMWFTYSNNYPIATIINPVISENTFINNYPNPFNLSTTIEYTVTHKQNTSIKVYDFTGRQVALLVNQVMEGGRHKVIFNARKYGCIPGIYVYKVEIGDAKASGKMILMK
jgi:hypothetical protein